MTALLAEGPFPYRTALGGFSLLRARRLLCSTPVGWGLQQPWHVVKATARQDWKPGLLDSFLCCSRNHHWPHFSGSANFTSQAIEKNRDTRLFPEKKSWT